MLEYHAAYYRDEESGWYVAEVLDFPGAVSQGRTLRSARRMIRDALEVLATWLVEEGELLPRPNPRARARDAEFMEALALEVETEADPPGEVRKNGHTRIFNPTNRQRGLVPRHRTIIPALVRKICTHLDIPVPAEC